MFKDIIALLRALKWHELDEPEQVVEETGLEGLYWIKNQYLTTTQYSRIVLPDPGQGNFTAVYHANDFSDSAHGGYELFGIHIGQTDVLTFLATDDREMFGTFVDCREDSSTLHKKVDLAWKPNPDRALVISRGIAHLPDHVNAMVTLNQPRLYWDFYNPQFDPSIDVLNVPRDAEIHTFPSVRVNRYKTPTWLCRQTLRMQRLQLRAGLAKKTHPYRFRVGGHTITIEQQEEFVDLDGLNRELLRAEGQGKAETVGAE